MKPMTMKLLAALLCLPALAAAHINWNWDGGNNNNADRPSIPPSLHRPALPAHVLAPGQGRSGVHIDVQRTSGSGRTGIYPYDDNEQFTGFGASTRWGLAPGGAEIGGSVDYPFFLPALFARYQPFGLDWPYGPYFTVELGATFMPDYYAGGALGFKLGPQLELWGAYRGGWVLDRGYSELSAGATLAAAATMDIGGAFSWRRYDTEPNEQTARVSLQVEFGNRANPLQGDLKVGGKSGAELLEEGNFKAAAQALEDELSVYPKDAVRWRGYASALEELGLAKKARQARLKALRLEAEEGGKPSAEPAEDEK